MSDVLIRNVPPEDLELIRAAAASQGLSLQAYLRETMHAQARYLLRQETLARVATRLRGEHEVTEQDRQGVLDAIEDAHQRRANDVAGDTR